MHRLNHSPCRSTSFPLVEVTAESMVTREINLLGRVSPHPNVVRLLGCVHVRAARMHSNQGGCTFMLMPEDHDSVRC